MACDGGAVSERPLFLYLDNLRWWRADDILFRILDKENDPAKKAGRVYPIFVKADIELVAELVWCGQIAYLR